MKIRAALPENVNKIFADDDDPISRMQAVLKHEMEPATNLGRSLDPMQQRRKLQFVSAEPILKPSPTRVRHVIESRYEKASIDTVPISKNQIQEEGLNTNRDSYLPGVTSTNHSGQNSLKNVKLKQNTRRYIPVTKTESSFKVSTGFATERNVRMSSSN